ncbi:MULTISPECIES: hypothetical protein [Rhizobium]|uniref:Uncharacterized protein n=1 Tax=Rhizobium rhododendri TaxID=2506430 RepID=A0ABY8IN87_9HYPH|nr:MULTISPECIES: hypothetical protein [Rhizobium]TQX86747.1 hypothetical protein EQW76_16405 [Rhizobium sp. rho-13.1]TQY11358.1 hypothetical protein EQW74_17720 [Rhizobium sp. rho-1.1]WFS24945.1 hypothetical protein PR018_21865 [Rhizobium rhododendri]
MEIRLLSRVNAESGLRSFIFGYFVRFLWRIDYGYKHRKVENPLLVWKFDYQQHDLRFFDYFEIGSGAKELTANSVQDPPGGPCATFRRAPSMSTASWTP